MIISSDAQKALTHDKNTKQTENKTEPPQLDKRHLGKTHR